LVYLITISFDNYLFSFNRKLEDGDIVNVDVTVYYKGVHGKASSA